MSDMWIVQWYSRRDIGEPDRQEGRVEYDNGADARKTYISPETQAMVGPFWRVELQRLPAPETAESSGYREVAE